MTPSRPYGRALGAAAEAVRFLGARMSYTCQYDCPGSSVPVSIKVHSSNFTLSSSEWCFQHNNAAVLYEAINSYYEEQMDTINGMVKILFGK